MTVTTVEVGTYLSEVFPVDLPSGVYLNKVIVGSGATHSAIVNNKNYVIAVPYVNLVLNKAQAHSNLLAVHGDISIGEIYESLLLQEGAKKIICTYDSLSKVMKAINPAQYKLMVDESHCLVDFSQLKPSVCKFVIDNYTSFGEWLFVSATPTKAKYLPEALRKIPVHTVNWVGAKPVHMKIEDVRSLDDAMFNLCGAVQENLHFFSNDIMSIRRFLSKLKKAGYSRSDVRLVMSTSGNNEAFLSKSLSRDWAFLDNITDPVCKINVYTSTAFVGCDIYDETGRTYICVDGDAAYTKLDMTSVIPQVIGRLRDSVHRSEVFLLVKNLSDIANMSEDEYMEFINDKCHDLSHLLSELPTLRDIKLRANLEVFYKQQSLVCELEEGGLCVNELGVLHEMQKYLALHAQYTVKEVGSGETKSLTEMLMAERQKFVPARKVVDRLLTKAVNSYTTLAKMYVKAIEGGDEKIVELVAKKEPEIVEHYNLIGSTRMRACNFKRSNIELECQMIGVDWSRHLNLQNMTFYSNAELKHMIGDVYKKLRIHRTAKATDVLQWWVATRAKGGAVNGFKILNRKTMLRGKEGLSQQSTQCTLDTPTGEMK